MFFFFFLIIIIVELNFFQELDETRRKLAEEEFQKNLEAQKEHERVKLPVRHKTFLRLQ